MTSFFRALHDAKETDVNGQKVLKVPVEQPELLDKLQLSRRHGATELNFLLRAEYEQLIEQMQACAKRGAIVVGTSGIGKSAFRFYVMRQWLKGHEKLPKARFPKVIFNLGDAFYEMDDSCAVHELPEVRSLAKLPADRLALLDPCVQIAGLDKSLHFKFMLVTTSASLLSGQETKVGNYKQLIKAFVEHELGGILVMHMWSYEEIKAVAPDASDELIRNFGCVPRWCFRNDLTEENSMRLALGGILENHQLPGLHEFFCSACSADTLLRDKRLPYKAMKVDGDGTDNSWGTKSFISSFVARFFLEKARDANLNQHAEIASMMKNPFSMQAFGHMFEEWAYKQLAQGKLCALSESEMKGSFAKPGSFERSDVKNQPSMKPKLKVGILLKAPVHYGSIDMVGVVQSEDGYQLLMFQETVGKKHRAAQWGDVQTIVGACKAKFKSDKKELQCMLIYLVPRESFESFVCPECPSLDDKNVPVSKGRLNVDMPDALTHLKTWEEALKAP